MNFTPIQKRVASPNRRILKITRIVKIKQLRLLQRAKFVLDGNALLCDTIALIKSLLKLLEIIQDSSTKKLIQVKVKRTPFSCVGVWLQKFNFFNIIKNVSNFYIQIFCAKRFILHICLCIILVFLYQLLATPKSKIFPRGNLFKKNKSRWKGLKNCKLEHFVSVLLYLLRMVIIALIVKSFTKTWWVGNFLLCCILLISFLTKD
jgi:hypothetical protein